MLDPAREIEDHSTTVSLVVALADYAAAPIVIGEIATVMARLCLVDALGRCFEALRDPAYRPHVGPLVPGALMPGGARVPGTSLELDPAQAAFCNALLLSRPASRNPWQAPGSGPTVDSLGAILAIADYHGRRAIMEGRRPPKVSDVFAATAKTLQIQGVLASEGGNPQTGTATLRLARVATAAVVTAQLGGTQAQIAAALSCACIDGSMLVDADEPHDVRRSRDWATADAIGRAVRHACQAMAAAQSSYLTLDQLEIMDVAGRFLGAKPPATGQSFGAGATDRLVDLYEPREFAPVFMRFNRAVEQYFPARQAQRIKAHFAAPERLDELPVNELLAALVTNGSR